MAEGSLGSNLTLEMLMETKHDLEARMAAFDADAFVRLGVDGYKGYRILKHGGIVLVGGHERGGSRGPEIVAMIRSLAPNVRVHLTEFAPDGAIYLIDGSASSP